MTNYTELEEMAAELRDTEPAEGSKDYRRLQILEDAIDMAPNLRWTEVEKASTSGAGWPD